MSPIRQLAQHKNRATEPRSLILPALLYLMGLGLTLCLKFPTFIFQDKKFNNNFLSLSG